MTVEHTEVLWIESRSDYSAEDVATLSGLPAAVIDELVACGVLPFATVVSTTTHRFEAESVTLARAAGRLREHFELDANGVAVAVSLLRRVRHLEIRMAALQALVPDRSIGSHDEKRAHDRS